MPPRPSLQTPLERRPGKRVRNALYIHAAATDTLPDPLKRRLAAAIRAAGDVAWNVARLEPSVVGLLLYADFEADPFPPLVASTRVDLETGKVASRNYSGAENPLILHRKELLAPSDHPEAAKWAALTVALQARGLFKDPHLIGRRNAWRERLAAAGVRVEAHVLCQK